MGNTTKYASSESATPNGVTGDDWKNGSLESRYDNLATIREVFLKRARECSALTIPGVILPAGWTYTSELIKPWQSIGARSVNNLASKILLAVIPPNAPFFRFDISPQLLALINKAPTPEGADEPEIKTELDSALGMYEKELMSEIETTNIRTSTFESLIHLIVGGNVTQYMLPEGGMKVYHLDKFVCVRDPAGNILELITEEKLSWETLPEAIQGDVKVRCDRDQKVYRLHTCLKRVGKKFITYQEVKGIKVPDSDGSYPLDKSPYLVLRWSKIDGEDYGRGLVEQYYGDLNSLEMLTRAIVQGSAAAAKALFLVNPNGVTKLKTIAEAPNGAIRTGNAADVSVLQMNKYNDFRVALETISQITTRLEAAFLLAGSVQRNAERVTAEEIRLLASELEDALGGVYSLLAIEFQLPLVTALINRKVKKGDLKALPGGKSGVKPKIVTGLDALSRSHDLQNLDLFIQGIAQEFGPQIVGQYLNVGEYLARRATAIGIDRKGLVKPSAQVQQEQQAAQQQQSQQNLISQVAPHATKAIGDIAKESLKNGRSSQGGNISSAGPAG